MAGPVKARLEWLEAMRGLAACWVLTHHASQAVRGFLGAASHQALANGYLGIDFFFVLSGFIIAFSSQTLVTSGRGMSDYLTARAIRIYVPYLPVGLAMLVLYAALPTLSAGAREGVGVLTSLTLLPTNAPPALSVAWTLVHEILFYAIFSLFFVSRLALLVVLAVWIAAILAAWAVSAQLSRAAGYLLSPLNLCFVLGVAVAWATSRGVSNRIGAVLAASGALLVVSQAMTLDANRLLITLGFACLVAASRASVALALSPGRALLTLGAASYSIYLVHNPALSALVRVSRAVHNPAAAFALICAGALCAGLTYHFLWERRALRWARAKAQRFTHPSRQPSPAKP